MKTIDIEALLAWAYTIELPKAPVVQVTGPGGLPRGFDSVHHYGQLLATVDDGSLANAFGLYPDFTATTPVDRDAVEVWEAVQELDGLALALPADWDPLDDMGDLGPEGRAAVERALTRMTVTERNGDRILRKSPRLLIEKHAILGGCPDWEAERPERKVVTEHGKPKWFRRVLVSPEGMAPFEAEVDGFDAKRRRPYPGAYQKFVLS